MMFWIVTLAMLSGAVLCILVPLARRQNDMPVDPGDVFYSEQLQEIESKIASGAGDASVLSEERAEIVRRMLRIKRQAGVGVESGIASRSRVAASSAALILVPAITLGLYFNMGSANLEDVPLSAQQARSVDQQSVAQLVQKAEDHLANNPDDARGWRVLARVYQTTGQHLSRAKALRQLIRIEGRSAELLADLGETITLLSDNIVSNDAKQLFSEALDGDNKSTKAMFYLAVSMEQEGRRNEALKAWRHLAKIQPENAPWQALIAERLSAYSEPDKLISGPTREDIKDAEQLSSEDRGAMIKSMVARLAGKLDENPNDANGWLRLIRAYTVLGDNASAGQALRRARKVFENDTLVLKRLAEQSRSLGLSEGGN